MKDSKIILFNHIIHRLSFITKIFLFKIINLLLMINCEERYYNIIDNNDLFLIFDKDGYLRAFEKSEIFEKWRILFNNSFYPKHTNCHKLIDDDIFLYPMNDKLFLSTENKFL